MNHEHSMYIKLNLCKHLYEKDKDGRNLSVHPRMRILHWVSFCDDSLLLLSGNPDKPVKQCISRIMIIHEN